jgi:prevent-host-death family protein
MGAYSLAQAKQDLERLVEEALNGETVTITRDGRAVVNLTPAPGEAKRAVDPEFIEWMRERRKSRPSLGADSVTLVREMREEE